MRLNNLQIKKRILADAARNETLNVKEYCTDKNIETSDISINDINSEILSIRNSLQVIKEDIKMCSLIENSSKHIKHEIDNNFRAMQKEDKINGRYGIKYRYAER